MPKSNPTKGPSKVSRQKLCDFSVKLNGGRLAMPSMSWKIASNSMTVSQLGRLLKRP